MANKLENVMVEVVILLHTLITRVVLTLTLRAILRLKSRRKVRILCLHVLHPGEEELKALRLTEELKYLLLPLPGGVIRDLIEPLLEQLFEDGVHVFLESHCSQLVD